MKYALLQVILLQKFACRRFVIPMLLLILTGCNHLVRITNCNNFDVEFVEELDLNDADDGIVMIRARESSLSSYGGTRQDLDRYRSYQFRYPDGTIHQIRSVPRLGRNGLQSPYCINGGVVLEDPYL